VGGLVLLLAGSWACATPVAQVVAGEGDLVQHWVRSYEEELPGDSVQVLRPADSRTFPPSRFRMAYKFAADGTCEWFFLSPDDAHRFKPGRWTIERGDERLLRITADSLTTTFRIAELTPSVLRLVPRVSR
jgi:hypothetical protein